jgi:hypothetical protein
MPDELRRETGMRATLLTAVLALTLAGCASAQQAAGPAVTGSSLATTTAALQCSGPVYRTEHAADYADGLATVSQDAAHAMAQFVRQGVVQTLPTDGYRSEPAEGDRLLYSYAVDGRRKVALLLDPDVRDYTGHVGWGVASWAMCDPSELLR